MKTLIKFAKSFCGAAVYAAVTLVRIPILLLALAVFALVGCGLGAAWGWAAAGWGALIGVVVCFLVMMAFVAEMPGPQG
ncbi:MAG: hypothetical protein KKE73_10865 [Proteobacteria bacterium]|nr:hypothetical protein [Pseudomonadota bacterium]